MRRIFVLMTALIILSSCQKDRRTVIPPPNNLPVMHILFVGNSYTNTFGMPTLLEYISRSNPDRGFQIKTEMAVKGGLNLDGMFKDKAIQKILTKRKWDYIVIQPPHTWAVDNKRQKPNYEGARVWSLVAQKSGSRPVWFMTWIPKPGSSWYGGKGKAITRNPEFMYKHTYEQSIKLTDGYKMLLVPIGSIWRFTHEHAAELPIYAEDGANPTLQGAYLNAMIFYKYLTGGSISNKTYRPEQITDDQFIQLKQLAYLPEDTFPKAQ